jgi:NAD-dependent dihydropyrimidine dehydrogenase PreA subunit
MKRCFTRRWPCGDHTRKLSHFVLAPMRNAAWRSAFTQGEHDSDPLFRGGDLLRNIKLTSATPSSAEAKLVVHNQRPRPDINPDACIRCGWCIEACPTRVQPAVILEAAQRDDIDLAEGCGD